MKIWNNKLKKEIYIIKRRKEKRKGEKKKRESKIRSKSKSGIKKRR